MSTDHLRTIVTSVFKLGKGTALSRTEMRNLLIYNLHWFDPERAKGVIDAALSSGYLRTDTEGRMTPTFDVLSVEVDIDYRPPRDLDVSRIVRPLHERLLDVIMESGMEKKEAVRAMNRRGEELHLLFSCAAIYLGLERGLDMSRFYGEVENQVLYGER